MVEIHTTFFLFPGPYLCHFPPALAGRPRPPLEHGRVGPLREPQLLPQSPHPEGSTQVALIIDLNETFIQITGLYDHSFSRF